MELDPTPDSLTCSVCGGAIEDVGYLPATESGGTYEPTPEAAVCGSCGFNELGMAGCAPELDDVVEPGPNDALLFVRPGADGFEVVSAKS